ncbi:TPA: type II toxin-antitoxin system RelB/DinJ family antitoxin [Yersinia enterocolitica]|nr:type II toxin-antitoxin system RelB/DinJ family antitoxin [Yersinia enterocolitica]
MATISTRIDDVLKSQAEAIIKTYGSNPTEMITMLYQHIVEHERPPFIMRRYDLNENDIQKAINNAFNAAFFYLKDIFYTLYETGCIKSVAVDEVMKLVYKFSSVIHTEDAAQYLSSLKSHNSYDTYNYWVNIVGDLYLISSYLVAGSRDAEKRITDEHEYLVLPVHIIQLYSNEFITFDKKILKSHQF